MIKVDWNMTTTKEVSGHKMRSYITDQFIIEDIHNMESWYNFYSNFVNMRNVLREYQSTIGFDYRITIESESLINEQTPDNSYPEIVIDNAVTVIKKMLDNPNQEIEDTDELIDK